MRLVYVLVSLSLLASLASGQKASREQKIQSIFDLRAQISVLEKEILLPDALDVQAPERLGWSAIRILPREKYDSILAIRGGGAYYSFVRKTHEYGYGSDIQLEQGILSVGFAGADYGFLKDIGEIGLEDINSETLEVAALLKYVPPADEPSIRAEYHKLWPNYVLNDISFTRRLPAVVGHSYILRSISYDRSDIIVAFSLARKDADGSLILVWKAIENFPKPVMRREKTLSIQ